MMPKQQWELSDGGVLVPAGFPMDGLIYRYDGDHVSGSTVVDQSGNGFNASLINSPTVSGGKISFNGSNQYMQAVNARRLGLTSVNSALYFDGVIDTLVDNITLVGNERETGYVSELGLRANSDGSLRIYVSHLGAAPYVTFYDTAAGVVQEGVRFKAIFNLGRPSNVAQIVVDGSYELDINSFNFSYTYTQGVHDDIEWGRFRNHTFSTTYYGVSLYETALWDHYLSESEITGVFS